MPEFWKPSVATDVVAFAVDPEGDIRLLLIERGFEPFKGFWALPGGFHQENDPDLEHCACRELSEETGAIVKPHMIELLTVRSAKDRDPRQNRVISVSYMFVVNPDADRSTTEQLRWRPRPSLPEVKGADDARHAEWRRIRDIDPKKLAFDHFEIYKAALQRLVSANEEEALDHYPVQGENVREQLGQDNRQYLCIL